jgi:hypothetical protein
MRPLEHLTFLRWVELFARSTSFALSCLDLSCRLLCLFVSLLPCVSLPLLVFRLDDVAGTAPVLSTLGGGAWALEEVRCVCWCRCHLLLIALTVCDVLSSLLRAGVRSTQVILPVSSLCFDASSIIFESTTALSSAMARATSVSVTN